MSRVVEFLRGLSVVVLAPLYIIAMVAALAVLAAVLRLVAAGIDALIQ